MEMLQNHVLNCSYQSHRIILKLRAENDGIWQLNIQTKSVEYN